MKPCDFRSLTMLVAPPLLAIFAACGDNFRATTDGAADARHADASKDATPDAAPDAMVLPPSATNFFFNDYVTATVHAGNAWYFGGRFTRIYTKPAPKLVPLTASGAPVTTCDLGTGFDREVTAIAAAGTSLYVGGQFTTYKGVPVNHIAKLNATTCALDTTFSPPAANGFDGNVSGLAASPTSLFVVGAFSAYRGVANSAASIAKLDLTTGELDTTFSPPGPGNNGFGSAANAVAVSGTSVFVGGAFTAYRGATVSRIAKLDATSGVLDATFSPSGQGFNNDINTLLVAGNSLYVGGIFSSYRGVANSAFSLAKLDLGTGALDTTFSPLGLGNNGFDPRPGPRGGPAVVLTFATDGTSLYVGGSFRTYRGVANGANNLAKIDLASGALDTTFSPVGATANGFNAPVVGLGVAGTSLYCAGLFTAYRGVTGPSYVGKLDLATGALDATFAGAAIDFDQRASTVLAAGNTIWLGGAFKLFGGEVVNNIVKLDDVTFAVDHTFSPPANNGFDNIVWTLATAGNSLYVGGIFNTYRGVAGSAAAIAKLDLATGALDTTFSPPGDGNNGFTGGGSVEALTVVGTSLYVGGGFTNYRTTGDARNLAKLNLVTGVLDTTFSPPGNNRFNGPVVALAAAGTSLYVGGLFNRFDNSAVPNFLAKMDLTTGVIDTAFSPTAGDINSGISNQVYALAASNNALYVGGGFRDYRGVTHAARTLAKLDLITGNLDTTFSPPGEGNNGFDDGASVFALTLTPNALYVGGIFSAYRGVNDSAYNLAKLDPVTGALDTTFSPPGAGNNGFDDRVLAVGVDGSTVMVGGVFNLYRGLTDPALFAAKLNAASGVRE